MISQNKYKNSTSKNIEVRKHKVYLEQMNQITSLQQRAWKMRGEIEWQIKSTHKCQIKGFYLERQYEVMIKRTDLLLNLYGCFPICKIKILSFISYGPGTGLDIGATAVFPIFKE